MGFVRASAADEGSLPAAKKAKHSNVPSNEEDVKTNSSSELGSAYLSQHEITIHEPNHPPPCLDLKAAPFPSMIVALLRSQKGFTKPSPVQASTWPIAIKGRDVLAIAKTGSGKTLGFLLPVLTRCHKEKSVAKGPIGLIMAPTRELALQIASEATKFGKCVDSRVVAVYGGASKGPQVSEAQT